MPTLRRSLAACILSLILLGAAGLRLTALADRPLWQDECWTAAAIRDRDPASLVRQTDLPIPPLFALAAKAALHLAPPIERSSRLPAALFGCLTPWLIYRAARAAAASRAVALAAAALSAVSIMLIIWSREAKHYGIEATFAAAVAWLTFAIPRASPHARTRQIIALAAVAALAPWFGYGVCFAIGPLLALLFVTDPRTGRRHVAAGLIASGATALSVGALWLTVAAGQAGNAALQAFWMGRYIHAASLESWFEALSRLALSSYFLAFPGDWLREADKPLTGTLLLAVAVAGLVFWPRRGRRLVAVWFVAPLALMALAAAAHRYPFGVPRIFVVCSPAALILIAAGLVALSRAAAKAVISDGRVGILVGLVLCLAPAIYAINIPLHQSYWCYHDIPRVLRELQQQRKPGEKIFVSFVAGPGVSFYARTCGFDASPDNPDFIEFPRTAGNIEIPGFDYAARAREALDSAGRRFWIVAITDRTDIVLRELLNGAEKRGYSMEVAFQAGDRPTLGNAILLRLSR